MKNKGVLFIIISAMLMSTGGILIKSIDANAITIASARAFVAGLIFVPFLQWKKIRLNKQLLGLIFSYTCVTLGFVIANKLTTAANTIILQSTAPLWLYLGYLIFGKKKIVFREMLPRLIILIGILVIMGGEKNTGNSTVALGNSIALLTGIAYACVQYFLEKEYTVNDVSLGCIINFSMAIIIVVIFSNEISFANLDSKGWFFLICLGVFQIGLAYLLLIKGIRMVSAFKASIISLVEPILNPIWVFIFVGEIPSIYALFGFITILIGIIISIFLSSNTRINVKESI